MKAFSMVDLGIYQVYRKKANVMHQTPMIDSANARHLQLSHKVPYRTIWLSLSLSLSLRVYVGLQLPHTSSDCSVIVLSTEYLCTEVRISSSCCGTIPGPSFAKSSTAPLQPH